MDKVFIIAEAGVNHNGSIELAIKLIDVALEAGADAVKFQSIKFDQIYSSKIESKEFREQLAEDEYNFVREMTDPDKAAAEWDDLFVDLSRNYKSIRKDSSPIVIKFRILFFVIANRLHIKKILKILKHN